MGTNVSYCCGTDVIPSTRVLAVTLLADPAFEEELKKEYPWVTSGIQKISNFTSGLLAKKEDCSKSEASYDSIRPFLSCLGLAAENRNPSGLEGVLNLIHRFECTDKRDRLYGTLALIEWRNPHERKQLIPRPIPDYEKDPFRLAAEVFCMLSPGPPSSADAPVTHALHWVQHLFEIFGLDPSDQVMRDTLVKRYTTPVKIHAEEEETDKDSPDRTQDRSWCAMRICDSSSPEAQEHWSLHIAEPTAGEKFVTLLDHENIPFAQAPLQTSAGDFYVEMSEWFTEPRSWSTLGIIVKRSTDPPFQRNNRHSLLGLARRFALQISISKRKYGSLEHQRFYQLDIHWDVDDIFLLYVTTLHQDQLDIEHLVTMRLCDPERKDSSFARFGWSSVEPDLNGDMGTPQPRAFYGYKGRRNW